MFRLTLRAVAVALLALALASCGARPRPTVDPARMFEIRAVAITAPAGISRGILAGLQRQMDLSIDATVSPIPLPRAVMTIRIDDVRYERTPEGSRALAYLTVSLSDVESGQVVLVRDYVVLAFADRGRVDDAVVAGAVAARFRVEYGLSMPAIHPVVRHDPALSTRLKGERQRVAPQVERVVVPLKSAPVLGADQDPVLNSRTRAEPKATPARIEPALKSDQPKTGTEKSQADDPASAPPTQATVESGAKAKVVIQPKAATPTAVDDDPCVETLDSKC